MFDWLGGILQRAYSGLADLASEVRQALALLISTFVSQFIAWVDAAVYAAQAAYNLWAALVAMLVSLLKFGYRLMVVYLPNVALTAFTNSVSYVERRVADLINFIYARIAEVIALAQQLYLDLRSWAIGQVTAIWNRITQIVTLLDAIADRVIALLFDPRALADWVAGAIVGAVWRWTVGNASTLARIALASAVSSTVSLASLLEQIITDVFL